MNFKEYLNEKGMLILSGVLGLSLIALVLLIMVYIGKMKLPGIIVEAMELNRRQSVGMSRRAAPELQLHL